MGHGLFYRIQEAKVVWKQGGKKGVQGGKPKYLYLSLNHRPVHTIKFKLLHMMHSVTVHILNRGDNGFLGTERKVRKILTYYNGLWPSTPEPHLTKPHSLVFSSSQWASHRGSTDIGDTER